MTSMELPPTPSMVNGEAAGAPRTESSSVEKYHGNKNARAGMSSKMENRESNSGNGLGDSKSGTESNELERNKVPIRLLTLHVGKSVLGRHELIVATEVKKLHRDAITLESLHSHNEEKTSQHGLRDEVENGQERSRHGVQC
jgi:hypothetical protein